MPQADIRFIARDVAGTREVTGGGFLAVGASATAANLQLTVPTISGFTGKLYARVRSDVWARVAIGASPDPAAAGATLFGPGHPPEDIPVTAGQKVAFIAGVETIPDPKVFAGGLDTTNAAISAFMTHWLLSLPTAQPNAGSAGWWNSSNRPVYFAG